MAGATRRQALDIERQMRDPSWAKGLRLPIIPRSIDIAWTSIGRGDLLPGELVFNRADSSLVYRNGDSYLRRFDPVAVRTI